MTQRYIDLAFDDTSPRSFGGFDNENEATVIRLKVLDPDAKYYIEIEQACGKHDKYCSDVLPIADGYAAFEVSRNFTHETLYVQGVMKVDGMCRKTARVRVGFSHSINALDELPESHPSWAENIENQLGNLADLTTEDKSSLVAAINEAAESGGSKDAVTYTPQTLTEEQQKQARENIGAGQPLFVVNVTTTLGEQGDEVYTADKTAAEIETADQAGYEIVCRASVPVIGMGLVTLQLPLKAHIGPQIFMFATNQTIWTDNSSRIDSYVVTIAFDGVSVGQKNTEIYIKPASGIPKSDLADDVQTSLNLAGTALQAVPGTYRTAAAQDELDTVKQPKAITDVGGHFGENPTVESALQQLGGALILRTWTD